MSSPERRRELQRLRDIEYEKQQEENRRLAARSMWERIEEAQSIGDIREILHDIAQHTGLE